MKRRGGRWETYKQENEKKFQVTTKKKGALYQEAEKRREDMTNNPTTSPFGRTAFSGKEKENIPYEKEKRKRKGKENKGKPFSRKKKKPKKVCM